MLSHSLLEDCVINDFVLILVVVVVVVVAVVVVVVVVVVVAAVSRLCRQWWVEGLLFCVVAVLLVVDGVVGVVWSVG